MICFRAHSPLLCPSEVWALYQPAAHPPAGYCAFTGSFATLASLKGLGVFYWDPLNPNLGRQGRDSEQKLSCVSQLPSYQSQDLISFLKGPIVSSKDCEIVPCWVTVNGRAAGPAGMALPEQLTAVHEGGRCEDLTPSAPPSTQEGKLLSQPPWAFTGQIPFWVWITCISPAGSQVLFHTSYSQKKCQSFDPGYWLTRGILYSMGGIMPTEWPRMCAQTRELRSKGLAAHGISTWFLWLWELQVQPVFMKVTSAHNCVISSIY